MRMAERNLWLHDLRRAKATRDVFQALGRQTSRRRVCDACDCAPNEYSTQRERWLVHVYLIFV